MTIDNTVDKMTVLVEDYDDELNADPIKLCFDENYNTSCSLKNVPPTNTPRDCQIQTIDLTSPTIQPNKSTVIKMPKPLEAKDDNVCYRIKQLAVQLVDLKKFPWYYKKHIKHYRQDSDIEGIVVGDCRNITSDICMKIKFDTNKGQWRVHERNINTVPRIKDRVVPKSVLQRNFNKIDFKRNKGLVGMTITQIINEERVCSSFFVQNDSGKDKTAYKKTNDLMKKVRAKLAIINKTVTSNTTRLENKAIIQDLRKDVKIHEKSVEESIETPPTELLNAQSNKSRSASPPRQNTTNTLSDIEIQTPVKHTSDSDTCQRVQKTDIRKERKPVCFACKVEPEKLISNNCKEETKNTKKSTEKRPLPIPTSDTNVKDISNLSTVSERKVAVINSSSKQFQDIRKFVEKVTKLPSTNKYSSIEKEAPKCNKSKSLDMPLLTEENNEKLDVTSHRRTSFKDSIVFENDFNSEEYLNKEKDLNKEVRNKTPERNNDTSSDQQNFEKQNIPVQQSNNSSTLPENVSTATAPTPPNTHTIPVVSNVNSTTTTSKPRIKYNPVKRDFANVTNRNVAAPNQSDYGRYSQPLERCSSTVSTGGHNTQNSIVQLLNAPPMTVNGAGIQHQRPVQQKSQYRAPSYQFNCLPPGYATPRHNSNLSSDYRMYGNNGSDVNSNYYYHNMYSGNGLSRFPQFSAPLPTTQYQTPQWQINVNYNADALELNNQNSSMGGWNNGSVGSINITSSPSQCNPTFSVNTGKTGNKTVSVDTVRAMVQSSIPTADLRNIDKNNIDKNTIPRTHANKADVTTKSKPLDKLKGRAASDSSSTNKTMKRPYVKKLPQVKRIPPGQAKNLDFLSKRAKTSPLPVSSHVKGIKMSTASTYSPPVQPIPTYENILEKLYNQATKPTNINIQKDAKAKSVKRKMPPELDKARKISIDEYKKRFDKSYSTDFNQLADRAFPNIKDRAGLEPKYATKKFKDGSYNLDQDLGYSSDTTVKL